MDRTDRPTRLGHVNVTNPYEPRVGNQVIQPPNMAPPEANVSAGTLRRKMVSLDDNEKMVQEAIRQAEKDLKELRAQHEKQAAEQAKLEKEAIKQQAQTPIEEDTPAKAKQEKVLEKPQGSPQEAKKIEKKLDKPKEKNDTQNKVLNIAARDYPDLYDGLGIDMNALGCIMLDTENIPVLQYMQGHEEEVNYGEEADKHYGVPGETEPHVTLLFGLLRNGHIWKDKVNQVLVGWSCKTLKIEEVSYFDLGDKYAVVGLVEQSEELIDGHERLTLLPHIQTHSEYIPHISLVYINKDANIDLWVKELGKRYNGRKVATKNVNYGDLPENEDKEPKSSDNSANITKKGTKSAEYNLTENHIEDEHDMDKTEPGCICCGGLGEHMTGFECYRCDASGIENDAMGDIPCDGREDSPNIKQDKDGTYEHNWNGLEKPVEAHTVDYCNGHALVTNEAREAVRNALQPGEREDVLAQEAALQNAIANLEGDIAREVMRLIENKDYESAEALIAAANAEGITAQLVLILAGYFTAVFPIYAQHLLAARLAQFGIQGAFNMGKAAQKYIEDSADKAANSHVNTILNDFFEAYKKASDNQIRQTLIQQVEKQAQEQDKNTLDKLPDNPNHEDIVTAVDGGKFDSDPAYKLARELARQGQGRAAIEKAIQQEWSHISQTRAKTIAKHEANRVFNMSQFQADQQFLNASGLMDKAYKRLVSSTNEPCPICSYLIKKTKNQPIPFNENFAKVGDTIETSYIKKNGDKAIAKMPITWENIINGVIHVNCNCRYELVIKNADGSWLNSLDQAALLVNTVS